MKITLFFFIVLCFVLSSSKSEDRLPSDQETQLNYDNETENDVAFALGHVHAHVSKKAKGVYGGANDNKRPQNKSGSVLTVVEPHLFFVATLGYVAVGFFL